MTMFAMIAAAVTLQADPAHSTAGFSVKHLMATTVRGEFDKFTSTLEFDKDDPTRSSVTAKLETASVDTHNANRDTHLKSPDFFDAKKCPEVTFKSTKFEKSGDNQFKVTGDLTMHCVTKPVTLDATFTPNPVKTPFGTMAYPAHAEGTLKRSDFGLTWNKALEGGGVLVSDEVKLELDVEYAPPPQPKKETKAEAKDAHKSK